MEVVFSDEVMEGAEAFVDILDGLFKPSKGNAGPWRSSDTSTFLQEYKEELDKMVMEGVGEERKMEKSRKNGDKKRKKQRKNKKHSKKHKKEDQEEKKTISEGEEDDKKKMDSSPLVRLQRVNGKLMFRWKVKPKEEKKKDDLQVKEEEVDEEEEKKKKHGKIILRLKLKKPKEEKAQEGTIPTPNDSPRYSKKKVAAEEITATPYDLEDPISMNAMASTFLH